jgi:hypothetical protein
MINLLGDWVSLLAGSGGFSRDLAVYVAGVLIASGGAERAGICLVAD